MPPTPLASNFLAGSLISLLLPVGMLIALLVWYVITVKRVPDNPQGSPEATAPKPASAPSEPPASER